MPTANDPFDPYASMSSLMAKWQFQAMPPMGTVIQSMPDLDSLAESSEGKPPKKKLVADKSALDALILPEALKTELSAVLHGFEATKKIYEEWGLGEVVEYGRATSILFWGKPGTGKTWAAKCIARYFGKEVISKMTGDLQSSEPGKMERNIKQAFAEATKKNAVLFFDECDGLLYDRATLGMILGAEVNSLLAELEKFEGIVIFATNRADRLDPALERRIAMIAEIPMPEAKERVKIWQRMLPKKMPLHEDVKHEDLAEYELTGGQIKNVVLQAAKLAIAAEKAQVSLEDFIKAIDRMNESKGIFGSHHKKTRARQVSTDESVDSESGHQVQIRRGV